MFNSEKYSKNNIITLQQEILYAIITGKEMRSR